MLADATLNGIEYHHAHSCRQVLMRSFLFEFYEFMRHRKKYWLIPIVLAMLFFGSLMILTQGSTVAPFIYALF